MPKFLDDVVVTVSNNKTVSLIDVNTRLSAIKDPLFSTGPLVTTGINFSGLAMGKSVVRLLYYPSGISMSTSFSSGSSTRLTYTQDGVWKTSTDATTMGSILQSAKMQRIEFVSYLSGSTMYYVLYGKYPTRIGGGMPTEWFLETNSTSSSFSPSFYLFYPIE